MGEYIPTKRRNFLFLQPKKSMQNSLANCLIAAVPLRAPINSRYACAFYFPPARAFGIRDNARGYCKLSSRIETGFSSRSLEPLSTEN